jgi:hypothetical protein
VRRSGIAWAALVGVVGCVGAQASRFDRAAERVRRGEWDDALAEYDRACALASDDAAKQACRDHEKQIFANRAADPEAKSPALASASASASSPAPPPQPAAPTFVTGAPQPGAYAIVVGIEHYDGLPAPSGAKLDAERFAEVARTSLGVPAANVHLLVDGRATKGSIERELEWVKGNATGGGRVYFYYSGHGAPDAASGSAYLVPVDGDPKFLKQTGLAVSDVMARLGESKAHDVLVILDSCFSGAGGRSVLPPGARPLVRVRDTPPAAGSSLALFSASSGAQISGPSADGQSGVFSKYVVAALGMGQGDINGDGQISLQELVDWVKPRVAREAQESGNREQTPTLVVGGGIGAASRVIVEWGIPKR